ncbi:unnamed protein product [Caretta caretta]
MILEQYKLFSDSESPSLNHSVQKKAPLLTTESSQHNQTPTLHKIFGHYLPIGAVYWTCGCCFFPVYQVPNAPVLPQRSSKGKGMSDVYMKSLPNDFPVINAITISTK